MVFTSVQAEPQITPGDVNLDFSITAADLVALQYTLLGAMTINEKGSAAADINSDGKINVIDFILLKEMISQ